MAQDRETIMVIEDDPDVRAVISDILRDAGFRVIQCADGEEAVAVLETTRPALITLDLAMPCIDGLQLLALLRERSATARVPVVVVTAAPEEIRARFLGEVEATIGKPFHLEQLLKVVNRSLGRTQPGV